MNFLQTRKQHGRVYATSLPGGLIVPWTLLPLGDYIKYTLDTKRGAFSLALMENEIFLKCVLDGSLKRQIDFLNAGIVTTVANNIWQYSGPTGIDSFNEDLENARVEVFGQDHSILNELVQLVTMAFPYTPEQVEAMPYDTFLTRVAQAEKKLLMLGMIQEPVKIHQPEVPQESFKKPKIDAKKLFEEQQQKLKQNKLQAERVAFAKTVKPDPQVTSLPKKKWWKVSPVLEAPSPQKIDFQTESREVSAFGSSGWEKADAILARDKMIKDSQVIYKDLLAELGKRKRGG